MDHRNQLFRRARRRLPPAILEDVFSLVSTLSHVSLATR